MKTEFYFKAFLTLSVTLILLTMVLTSSQNVSVMLTVVTVLTVLILATLGEADKIAKVLRTVLGHFNKSRRAVKDSGKNDD